MGRLREFDENAVLDRALSTFWKLGYDRCSIADLVEATGVQRQSLYNAYGDKRGLFLAVAARYRGHSAEALAPLEGHRVGVADVRRYFDRFLRTVREHGCGSCLMVRTAFSAAHEDPRIREVVDQASTDVRGALARAVESAMELGELPRKTDPAAEAAFLFASLHGLTALTETGASRREVAAALARVFERFFNLTDRSIKRNVLESTETAE